MVLFDAIHKVYPIKCTQALLTITPGYEPTSKSSQQRESDVESNLPPLLTSLHNHKHTQCTSHELVKLSEAVHETLAIKIAWMKSRLLRSVLESNLIPLNGLTIDLAA